MEGTNEERDELCPPPVHPFHLNQSDNAHGNYPGKYNMTLPRAWISMHGPRVFTGYISLEVGMTIVYICTECMYKYMEKKRPAASKFHCGKQGDFRIGIYISKGPINIRSSHRLFHTANLGLGGIVESGFNQPLTYLHTVDSLRFCAYVGLTSGGIYV